MRSQLFEDLAFDLLFFGRGLDHHVAIVEKRIIESGGDARQCGLLFGFLDSAAGDLARQVALDRRAPALHRVVVDIDHHDIEAGKRADMGDAAAHLPSADNADAVQPLESRWDGRWRGGAHWRRSSSSANSGRILNKSPTRP